RRDYAKQSQKFLEEAYEKFPKAHPELIKDYYKTKFNAYLASQTAKRFEKIQQQQTESEELLKNVPQTLEEAKGNVMGYIGGAIGEGLAHIPLTLATGGATGFLLEQGDIYNEGLAEKAKAYSEQFGIDVTPEQVKIMGED